MLDTSLLPPQTRTLIAVSSGADSTALLLAAKEAGCDIVAGHVNHDLHELRKGDCDDDEAWLRERCAEWQVPLVVSRLELPRRGEHVNEAVAREGRYAALLQMAREQGCPRLATAHTADDNLETLLLFWLRGSTVRGWGGIAPQRALAEDVLLVRPLLHATRAQLRAFLEARGQTWREDPSNRDPMFRRNRVRHELVPLLSEIAGREGGEMARQSVRAAELWRDDEEFLDGAARTQLSALTLHREPSLWILNGMAWRELHGAMQRRTLLFAARELGGAPSASQIEVVRRHVGAYLRRAVWQWPGDVACEWTGAHGGNRLRLQGVPKEV